MEGHQERVHHLGIKPGMVDGGTREGSWWKEGLEEERENQAERGTT